MWGFRWPSLSGSCDDTSPGIESLPSWISRKTSMMQQSKRDNTGNVGPSLTIMPLSRNIRDVTHLLLSLMQCSLCFHFQKWKHGIPLFPKVSHSVEKVSRHTDPLSDRVLKALLDTGVISTSPRKFCPFLFFGT